MKANRNRLPSAFEYDLKRVFDTDAPGYFSIHKLRCLEHGLRTWSKLCDRELEKELSKLPKNHPVKCPISLLGTRGYGRLEVAHTRTLAWLLDAREAHGFGSALLNALLRHQSKDEKLPAFAVETVEAEKFYIDSNEEDAGRTDIWIEGSWEKPACRVRAGLVVIEAKVDSSEGDEQLSRYDNEIKKRLAQRKVRRRDVHRIFLTRKGVEAKTGNGWKPLSFSKLARIFCDVANLHKAKPGYHFLRYYLAGVFKDILDLPIGRSTGRQNSYRLLGFLKENSTQREGSEP